MKFETKGPTLIRVVHMRFDSRTDQSLSQFKTTFVAQDTIVVLAGELAQTNRVWFFAPTLESIPR